jgi:amino acid adenylation domain-containing protein
VWLGGQWSRGRFAAAVEEASSLFEGHGLGPGHAVAVAVSPSPALALAWHGAHRIGATVLALDPSWPQPRLEMACRESQSRVLVTSTDGVSLTVTGSAGPRGSHAEDLAYLILTSGSTGTPKLVAIQHDALANQLSWSAATFPLGDHDRVLAHSSPGFDVTVWEMLGPLSWGACLVFPDLHRRNDAPHLAELIRRWNVTVVQAVPSLLEAIFTNFEPEPLHLRLLLSGGEAMPSTLPAIIARRAPSALLVNTYGPSETAIDATYHCVTAGHPAHERIPLGRPIAGICIYVVDDQLRLLPPGAWGQLAIAGRSIGRGYLNNPAETARCFVADLLDERGDARMYLTGDRARWNDDAMLEFGGRLDHQVKVRGNRVELLEVEAALRSLPMVRDAVVQLQDGGTMRGRLVAIVVPREAGTVTVHELHRDLAKVLPSYMTPSVFVLVEELPRLSNGKVAREALPTDIVERPTSPVAWQTKMESIVGEVWKDVIGHDAVERDLSFFASGGSSLLIPVLQQRLKAVVGITLSVPELFENSTIMSQALILEQRVSPDTPSSDAREHGAAADVVGRGKLRSRAYRAQRKRPRG